MLIEVIPFGAPHFGLGFHLYRLRGVQLDMDDRVICIHPDARTVIAGLELNFAGFELQGLGEGRGCGEGIGCEADADASQFEQLAVFAPSIGFGEEENEITVLLGPDVQREVAVAEGHGVIFVGAEGGPRHVVGGREMVLLRG